MKLILHVGHPKCASSTVQSLLWANRHRLGEQGMQLLGAGFRLPRETPDWDWPVWFLNGSALGVGEQLVARKAEFAAMGIETLILSAENLSDPEHGARLDACFDAFETSVIYYIRRQDQLLLSSWRQWGLKRGISVRQHILRRVAEGRPNYRATLEYYAARVGADRVHAAFLDPAFLTGGTVESDVWTALRAQGTPIVPAVRSNVSPDRAILLFLSGQRHLFSSPHDEAPVDALIRADTGPARSLVLDRHTQVSLKMIYDPINTALAREFMGRDDGANVIVADSAIDHDPFTLGVDDKARIAEALPRVEDPALQAAFTGILTQYNSVG
jgi:hypothetical protein